MCRLTYGNVRVSAEKKQMAGLFNINSKRIPDILEPLWRPKWNTEKPFWGSKCEVMGFQVGEVKNVWPEPDKWGPDRSFQSVYINISPWMAMSRYCDSFFTSLSIDLSLWDMGLDTPRFDNSFLLKPSSPEAHSSWAVAVWLNYENQMLLHLSGHFESPDMKFCKKLKVNF